jgi:virulence-associated protein VapD
VNEIQITDNQLFEIIGRKEVENYTIQKELDAYRVSLENTKNLATEVTALRAAKPALELSNKQLADKNIELDRALTEVRKEREAIRVELTQRSTALADAQTALHKMTAQADEAVKNVAILNQTVEDLRTQLAAKKLKK